MEETEAEKFTTQIVILVLIGILNPVPHSAAF